MAKYTSDGFWSDRSNMSRERRESLQKDHDELMRAEFRRYDNFG